MTKSGSLNEELVEIFMPLDKEAPYNFGKKEVYNRIGVKNFRGITVKGKKEFAEKYHCMLNAEDRAGSREKRCYILGKKKGLIKCPGCNSCSKCTKCLNSSFSTNLPISLDSLIEDDFGAMLFDVPDSSVDVESEIIAQDLKNKIRSAVKNKKDKRYEDILDGLLDGKIIQELSNELNIPWSSVKDIVVGIQNIVTSLLNQ